VIGPFSVTDVHEPEQLPEPVPVQPVNCQPLLAVSDIEMVLPAEFHPELGETDPPADGLACIVK
jgi:hypothetical protein